MDRGAGHVQIGRVLGTPRPRYAPPAILPDEVILLTVMTADIGTAKAILGDGLPTPLKLPW